MSNPPTPQLNFCLTCMGKGVVRGPIALAPCPNPICPQIGKRGLYSEPVIHMLIQNDMVKIAKWKAEDARKNTNK